MAGSRTSVGASDRDDVQDYLDRRHDVSESRATYHGEQIPDDLVAALEGMIAEVEEKKTDLKTYVIYDQYGIPSSCPSDKLAMVLKERHPQTGKHYFTPRRPKNIPEMLKIACPVCAKEIAENPYLTQGRMHGSIDWRSAVLKFRHMWARHREFIPAEFPDKDMREQLIAFTAR